MGACVLGEDGKGKEYDVANCHHSQCIISTLRKYNINAMNMVNLDNIGEILNDFLYLMHHHDGKEFEYIYTQLDTCDIASCHAFRRRNDKIITHDKNTDSKDVASHQILDKIHCYYQHCYDIGNRLLSHERASLVSVNEGKPNEQNLDLFNPQTTEIRKILQRKRKACNDTVGLLYNRTNARYNQLFVNDEQLQNDQTKETDTAAFKKYSFGIPFAYGYPDEPFIYKSVDIKPKYESFKQELLSNDIAILTIDQFDSEYQKALLHFHSRYYKDAFDSHILMQYVLALMIYCNYDVVQYEFCKTYRIDNGKRHNEFYWFGRYLKISLQFGTTIADGRKTKFYHGVGEKLLFPQYIGTLTHRGVYIYCPLSTSISFEVASNFTNFNSGLIVQFGGYSSKYLSLAWLSDFANESEYLFMQTESVGDQLTIDNVIDAQYGYEYHKMLNVFKIITKIIAMEDYSFLKEISSSMDSLAVKIIHHQLSTKLPIFEALDTLPEYGNSMVETYFYNREGVDISYDRMDEFKDLELFNVFFDPKSEWIRLIQINALFPNMKKLLIECVCLSKLAMDDILCFLQNKRSNTLEAIVFYMPIIDDFDIADVMSIYSEQFAEMQFALLMEYDEHSFYIVKIDVMDLYIQD
eukprot:975871_1